MRKIAVFIVIALCLSVASLLFSTASEAANIYKRVIVFGDSYSDNGNDFKISHGEYPNAVRYYQGRFSDGPVWAEYLAKDLNINPNNKNQFLDYAYGQAKILSPTSITVTGKPNKNYVIPDLSQQIDDYVTKYKTFAANDLVVLFISTNDFFDLQLSDSNAEAFFQSMADQQVKQIDRLIQLGAKHLIVLNGRDVTYSPLAEIYLCTDHATAPACLQKFRSLIQIYNQRLASELQSRKQVFMFDIYKFDNSLITDIRKGGFPYQFGTRNYVLKNSTAGCYHNNKGDYQGIAGGVCADPQQYFFYDRIHTTNNVSYLLAQNVYREFSINN